MEISVELTLMPLQNDYRSHIVKFITSLRNSKFKLLENPLSTQIYGDYDELMPFLTQQIKDSFQVQEHVLVNLKIVKSDRSTYESSF